MDNSGRSVFRRSVHHKGRTSTEEQLSSYCCGYTWQNSRLVLIPMHEGQSHTHLTRCATNYFSHTLEKKVEIGRFLISDWKQSVYISDIRNIVYDSSYLPLPIHSLWIVIVWSLNIILLGLLRMYFFAEIHPCLSC